jgi:hypothetical protein
LSELATIMEHHAGHVYRENTVLLQWHDAFSQPILLHRTFPEDQVQALADRFGTRYRMDDTDPTGG